MTGVARALRKKFPDVHVVAVEPASSPLVTQGRSGAHAIQGIGANFVPACLAVGEIDEFTAVTDEEAVETARPPRLGVRPFQRNFDRRERSGGRSKSRRSCLKSAPSSQSSPTGATNTLSVFAR